MAATPSKDSRQRAEDLAPFVVGIFVLLSISPFVFAATHTWFWKHEHYRAPGAAALFGLVVVALVMRQRWAWFILIIFNGVVVVSYAWEWSSVPAFVIDVVSFSLLVSSPMRYYVRRR